MFHTAACMWLLKYCAGRRVQTQTWWWKCSKKMLLIRTVSRLNRWRSAGFRQCALRAAEKRELRGCFKLFSLTLHFLSVGLRFKGPQLSPSCRRWPGSQHSLGKTDREKIAERDGWNGDGEEKKWRSTTANAACRKGVIDQLNGCFRLRRFYVNVISRN